MYVYTCIWIAIRGVLIIGAVSHGLWYRPLPLLSHMSPGPRHLSSIGWCNAEYISQGRNNSLQVELGGLGQVGLEWRREGGGERERERGGRERGREGEREGEVCEKDIHVHVYRRQQQKKIKMKKRKKCEKDYTYMYVYLQIHVHWKITTYIYVRTCRIISLHKAMMYCNHLSNSNYD